MTKRFNLSNPTNYRPIPKYIMIIHDDLEHRHLNVDDIVSLLNELAEENEQLKNELYDLRMRWNNLKGIALVEYSDGDVKKIPLFYEVMEKLEKGDGV